METQKITTINLVLSVTIMLFAIASLTACKTTYCSDNPNINKFANIIVLGYKNFHATNRDSVNSIPSYTFKIPKNMVKWGEHDIGITLVGLTDHQYIYIIYEPNEILDIKDLIDNLYSYLDTTNKELLKKIYNDIHFAEKKHRINVLIIKNSFKIGLFNIHPNNIDCLIKSMDDSFKITDNCTQ